MDMVNDSIRIVGNKVTLRPMLASDTDNILKWRNDVTVVKNFIYRKPVTRLDHDNWIKNKILTGQVHQFIIVVNETKEEIGSVYLQNFEEEHNKAEWGIFIGDNSENYGKGYGTEAASLLLKYAFETLKLHKVTSRVLAYNKASIRMQEKIGYSREALLKDELFLDGQYQDLILFGIINNRE